MAKNKLEEYFFHNRGNVISKWHHYFDTYERHFSRFRNQPVTLLEVGVYQGGSLQMWKDYFGPSSKIIGVDLNPECKQFENDSIQIIIGDQGDREFLRSLRDTIGHTDIVIDDGGHFMTQQIATFEELFPSINPGGVFLCEDLHTSYWPYYGGGSGKKGSFIEYGKRLIDVVNAWHYQNEESISPDSLTRSVKSLHFYSSMLVIEKDVVSKPVESETGVDRRVSGYAGEPEEFRRRRLRRSRLKRLFGFRK